jgi:hypothetical protein
MTRFLLSKKKAIQILGALMVLTWPGLLWAQAPGNREMITAEPAYHGSPASAPIPSKYHVRNEGGSDGAGLCVISSVLANGMYQGVPGLDRPGNDEASGTQMPGKGSALWQGAKRAPGGYSDDKLEALVKRTVPGEPYASHLGTDPSVLDRLSREGYPIGVTMNTGELYNGHPIHHMVSLLHYRSGGAACFMDNNDRPGVYRWISASAFARRWIDGGVGWAWIWTRLPATARSLFLPFVVAIVALVIVGRVRRNRSTHDLEDENYYADLDGLARRDALRPDSFSYRPGA